MPEGDKVLLLAVEDVGVAQNTTKNDACGTCLDWGVQRNRSGPGE